MYKGACNRTHVRKTLNHRINKSNQIVICKFLKKIGTEGFVLAPSFFHRACFINVIYNGRMFILTFVSFLLVRGSRTLNKKKGSELDRRWMGFFHLFHIPPIAIFKMRSFTCTENIHMATFAK